MELKEARKIVADYEKLPADRYAEAVAICIADDEVVDSVIDDTSLASEDDLASAPSQAPAVECGGALEGEINAKDE